MNVKALSDVVFELPEAEVCIELNGGSFLKSTGFVVRTDDRGQPIIIIKAKNKKQS